MADNHAVEARHAVLGFPANVLREFQVEVPDIKSAWGVYLKVAFIQIWLFAVVGLAASFAVYAFATLVWPDAERACATLALTNVKAAKAFQFFASFFAACILGVAALKRAPRKVRVRVYFSLELLRSHWSGAGAAQRALERCPECCEADDFARAWLDWGARFVFWAWVPLQSLAVLAFFLVPATCG